ncbi:hypothetical protein SASPL_110610 [Salvia splendens]|uniref:Uncharacterized protein n=1 Tax=Salvia splendens TaxID=180675 RepID=A0A8X9A2J9_SALSN|nr:hypothetical protein SASPL_110610 [Salvia splendens]
MSRHLPYMSTNEVPTITLHSTPNFKISECTTFPKLSRESEAQAFRTNGTAGITMHPQQQRLRMYVKIAALGFLLVMQFLMESNQLEFWLIESSVGFGSFCE